MHCVKCDTLVIRKGRKYAGRCPACGHRFALNLKLHGVDDGFIKRAVDAITDDGKHKFLPEQLEYEVFRRSKPLGPAINAIVQIASPIWIGFELMLTRLQRPYDAQTALKVFSTLNEDPNQIDTRRATPYSREATTLSLPGLTDQQQQPAQDRSTETNDSSQNGVAPGRLLVCERPEYREFFLANEFQIYRACHVIAPDILDSKDGIQLLEKFRNAADLKIFILHDATPAGMKFAEHVRSDPQWFGDQTTANIMDLGIGNADIHLLDITYRSPTATEQVYAERDGLSLNIVAEISAMRPSKLLRYAGIAVEDEVPFESVPERIKIRRKKKDKDTAGG